MASVQRVGYAVVGLGGISQVAVLPAFAHSEHAELVSLVSGDKAKAEKLAAEFKAQRTYTYSRSTLQLRPASTRDLRLPRRGRASMYSARSR
jgi:hypothetical protein